MSELADSKTAAPAAARAPEGARGTQDWASVIEVLRRGTRFLLTAHENLDGDAAVDQFIAALKPVHAKHGPGDRRHTLIHGQFTRRGDQLDQLKELDVIASLFPMHTFY